MNLERIKEISEPFGIPVFTIGLSLTVAGGAISNWWYAGIGLILLLWGLNLIIDNKVRNLKWEIIGDIDKRNNWGSLNKKSIIKKSGPLIKPGVLIFEDDINMAEIYGKAFMEAGLGIKIYNTYKDLVGIVIKENPDIIYCDIIMPDMNGLDAIRLLKENEKTKNIPLVAVSNISDKEIKEKSLKAGAIFYCCIADYAPKKLAETFSIFLKPRAKAQH